MSDAPETPRKSYGFKPREFIRDNPPPSSPASSTAPTAGDLARLAGPTARQTPSAPGPKAGDPNDVYAVLERNRAHERKQGLDDFEIRKTSSRRKRDYWLVFLSVEIFFGAIAGAGVVLGNPFFFVGGIAAMVILGLAITWIMWQLMDRY